MFVEEGGHKGGKSWKKENSKAEMGGGIKEQIRGLGLSAPALVFLKKNF